MSPVKPLLLCRHNPGKAVFAVQRGGNTLCYGAVFCARPNAWEPLRSEVLITNEAVED